MNGDDLRKCKCENIRCNRVFRWREELRRYKKECTVKRGDFGQRDDFGQRGVLQL